MNENEYFVTHSAGHIPCDSISRELSDGSFEEISYQEVVDKLNENRRLKQQLNMKLYSHRQLEAFYDRVFDLIDMRIKAYEHKPFSAPISNPANPNFDDDVDRLARLSELEQLRKELKE